MLYEAVEYGAQLANSKTVGTWTLLYKADARRDLLVVAHYQSEIFFLQRSNLVIWYRAIC